MTPAPIYLDRGSHRAVITYDPPPIPGWRNMAWVAWWDNLGADSSAHGYGANADEALADLIEGSDL